MCIGEGGVDLCACVFVFLCVRESVCVGGGHV